MIRKCSSSLSHPIALLFNSSLRSSTFPTKWKNAFITPIFKSGNKNDVSNYRPLSIISVIPKILDSILTDKLITYLMDSIISQQHGFLKKRSTITNLVSFEQYILKGFYDGLQTDAVYTEFSKAFDKVNHERLLQKLKTLGVSDYSLTCFRSNLTNRTQTVRIKEYKSRNINATSGVEFPKDHT